jgi:hypothetical protein
MNVTHEIAEARATALSLRASAKACTPEQGALKFRLMRAAESLNAMVLLAMHGIECVEQLEMQLQAVEREPGKVHALTPAEDADVGDAFRAVHERLEHARERVAQGMRAVDRYDHAIITNVLVLVDHHAAVELTDARIERDSTREQAMHAMSRQIARLRAALRVMDVTP